MDKNILKDYIDACELIRETEEDIRKLERRKEVVHDSVRGSNPDFPYQPQSFRIEGTQEDVRDEICLEYEKKLLEERKTNAERLKLDVEAWMNTIPIRMQRIIKHKIFEELTWEQTAMKIGKKATGDSVRMELERFLKNN